MSLKIAFLASASLFALACSAGPETKSGQGVSQDALSSGGTGATGTILPALPPGECGDAEDPVFEAPPGNLPTPLPVVDSDAGAPGPNGPEPTLPIATYDACGDKKTGDECSLCAPWETDCVETAVVKVCNSAGTCQ